MLKNKLKITALFIAVLSIISLMNLTVFAAEQPDLGVRGTITISMKKNGKTVSGGEFEIYHIANISKSDHKYVYTKAFKNCPVSPNNSESDEIAPELEKYVKINKLTGIRKNVDSNGIAEFSGLKTGLYFVIQNKAAKGYSKANSFTVSLPSYEDGKYNYAVNAKPKFSVSGSENTTQTQNTTVNPSKPTDANLPQTGQLNLPIPILTVLGVFLVISGAIIRIIGRKEENEK